MVAYIVIFIDDGTVEAYFTENMFRSPDPGRQDRFGAIWDMFIESIASRYPEDFERVYDLDRGYPIVDPASVELWERYTDEFVASPQELTRSFTEFMATQSFEVQARRIWISATDEFWATHGGDHNRAAFNSAMADASEEALAELRAIPLETEADRTMREAFVPLADAWIELFRQGAAEGTSRKLWFFCERTNLEASMDSLIDGCFIPGLPG